MAKISREQGLDHRSAERQRSVVGLTIVELLVVMAIASVLMGLSISSFARVGRGPAIEVAEREVRSALGRARMSARQQSALCQLTVSPMPTSTIRLTLARDAGAWQFHDVKGSKTLGGRNNFAQLSGVKIEDGGVVRTCAVFDGGGEVICDANAGYDPTYGFDITLYVRPMDSDSAGPLVSMGDAFQLELTAGGGLSATLDLEQGTAEMGRVATAPGVVAPGVWARVGLFFDGSEIRITAHEVVEALKPLAGENMPGPARLTPLDAKDRLKFGGKGFRGAIDEILYRTAEEEEVTPLATGRAVEFDHASDVVVRFDHEGRLDPRLHTEAVEIAVKDEQERRVIRVDLSGVIR
jgi:type II secretory pathway pseudopilin PulG